MEKLATITGLFEKVKTLKQESTMMKKKVDQSDKLMGVVATKDKEISNLKVQINTKSKLLANAKCTEQETLQNEIVEVTMVKRNSKNYSQKHWCFRAAHGIQP